MCTLFISDLHLENTRPEMTSVMLYLLSGPAREASALYILGDLFEYWIGDDAPSATATEVQKGIRSLTDSGVPCYFMHGNRDFLLGGGFADAAGMEILPDPHVVDLYGIPTLLMHGDTLCTDDDEYQAFRQQVRNPDWQKNFLAKPVSERRKLADQARDASKQHMSSAKPEIMDVNPEAVAKAFARHDVRHMIHGHTHRAAFHQHELEDGTKASRIVLADWYERGSLLRVSEKGAVMEPVDRF